MSLVGSFESHVRTLKTRLETAERRGVQLERALAAAQRQIAGSKDAESMRLLSERNEHLSQQLEALRDALRGGNTPTKQRIISKSDKEEDFSNLNHDELVAKVRRLNHELKTARESAASDVDALVAKLTQVEVASSAIREELKREKIKSNTLEEKAHKAEEQLHGTIAATVPKDAVPGISRFMVTYTEDDKKKTATVQVPSSAIPGTSIKLSRRVIELEERRELDLDLAKTRTLLDKTAGELGTALDAKRRAENRVDLLEATNAALMASHAHLETERTQLQQKVHATQDQVSECSTALLTAQQQHQNLIDGPLTSARQAHDAANVAGQALREMLEIANTAHATSLQQAHTETEAQTRAATRKATGLINDLRTQLKRESHRTMNLESKLLGIKADLAATQTKLYLFEKEHQAKEEESRQHDKTSPSGTPPPSTAPCGTCQALATRLEQLLADNAHGRERIAFLETTVQHLHHDIDELNATRHTVHIENGHPRSASLNNTTVAADDDSLITAATAAADDPYPYHQKTTTECRNGTTMGDDDTTGTISV